MSIRKILWPGFVAVLIGVLSCDDSPTGPDTEVTESPFRIEIDCVDDVVPGSEVEVNVRLTRAPYATRAMSLTLIYDSSRIGLLNVNLGDLVDLGWRGYNSQRGRSDPPYESLLAMFGASSQLTGREIPTLPVSGSPVTVLSMRFEVSAENCNCGAELPIRFVWQSCADNFLAYYRPFESDMIRAGMVRHVFEAGTDIPLLDGGPGPDVFCGEPDTCDEYYQSMPTPPRPMIDFVHGSVYVIDYRGDLNLNGRVEVADGVLYSNYFANGETIDYVDSVQQAWMSDINEDGEPFTSADAVCLIKHLATGEELPHDMEPICVNCTISDGVLSCDESLSLVFCRWEGTEGMEILHPDFHGSHSTDGVSSWASIQTQNFVASEPGPLLRLNAEFVKVDVADHTGAPVILTLTNNDVAPRHILTAEK